MSDKKPSRAFIAGAVVALAVAAPATAALALKPWKTVAIATDTSQYYAYASASSDVSRVAALAARATASEGTPKVSWRISCSGEFTGQILRQLNVAAAKECSVSVDATAEDGGRVTVSILKR